MRKVSIVLITLVALGSAAAAQPPAGSSSGDGATFPERTERAGRSEGHQLAARGAVILLATWGLSFGLAAGSLDSDNRGLYLPVVGPWIVIADRASCSDDGDACDHDTATTAVIALDGVLQVGSAVMIITGLVQASRERDRPRRTGGVQITPTTVGTGGPGVTVSGWF